MLTHGLGLRGGQHTETVVPTLTLIKTMYLSEKRTLSWDTHTLTHTLTHTQALEASLHALVPDSPIISLHLTVSPQFSLCVLVSPSLALVLYFFIIFSHFCTHPIFD